MLVILRRGVWLALFAGAALAGLAWAAETPIFNEYQMKAAFLLNFAKYVEWPGDKGANAMPIILGTFGHNPFGDYLESLAKGRRIDGREIQVRHFDSLDAARAAHVLFVGKRAKMTAAEVSSALERAGVLVVGESTAFSEWNGIITFQVDGDRLAFDIDMQEAGRADLKISAQLQKLAGSVRRR
jgi:hypothetical protein